MRARTWCSWKSRLTWFRTVVGLPSCSLDVGCSLSDVVEPPWTIANLQANINIFNCLVIVKSTAHVTYRVKVSEVLCPTPDIIGHFRVCLPVRLEFYGATDPTATQLAEDADETLFSRIKRNPHHVLYWFLPKPNCHQHSLRPRRHNFSLSINSDDRNFIIRQLFSDNYWSVVIMTRFLNISHLPVHTCNLSNGLINLLLLLLLLLLFFFYTPGSKETRG